MPGVNPVTTPIASTVATVVLLLLHAPPGVLPERVVDEPIHALGVPEITTGNAFTVTVVVVLQPDESR